jgi:hypothetical protein
MKRSSFNETAQSKRQRADIDASAMAAAAATVSKETFDWFDRFNRYSAEIARQQHAEREFCRKNNTETLGSRILCSFCKLDYVICRRVNCPKRATEAER